MKEVVYIEQREPQDSLYHQLQEKMLNELQNSAGEVWTDYNPHDPGLTIGEALNYALTELDYRLRFGLEDYLVPASGVFKPQEMGLFTPIQVFPVSPVTGGDYRKLLTDGVEEVENVWIYPVAGENLEKGWYDILVELSPMAALGVKEGVKKKIVALYHANRNLCEGLHQVNFIERRPLQLNGEIEVKSGVDPLDILGDIYWEALQFFTEGLSYKKLNESVAKGERPDEILDGPQLKHWIIDNASLRPLRCHYSVASLYRRLLGIKGIVAIRSLQFYEEQLGNLERITVDNPACSYTVAIPGEGMQNHIRLFAGGVQVKKELSGLPDLLYARHARYFGEQHKTKDLSGLTTELKGQYHPIYTHESVQNEFPECYGINKWGVASGESAQRKAQAHQLKAYLLLFDEVFARGLKELEHIPELMEMRCQEDQEGIVPLEAPETMWDKLTDSERIGQIPRTADRILEQKKYRADVWDKMYGEESNPDWLRDYDFYELSAREQVERRMAFLKRIPEWGRDRFKALNLKEDTRGNMPGIKAYVGALLGWETEMERPVVNILPIYNLRLIRDDHFYNRPDGILSHDLVPEDMLRPENMEFIPQTDQVFSDQDYHLLKARLPLLHYNLLFEGLFREGVRMENYRLLNIPYHPDRLLIFRHRQREVWINLGRFHSRPELQETANCLRRFLVMLNRKSEGIYILEHLYMPVKESFAVTVVLPGWSVRMNDLSFRRACEELICRRLPAHLRVRFAWLDVERMWEFERAYYDWRRALGSGDTGEKEAERIWEKIKAD